MTCVLERNVFTGCCLVYLIFLLVPLYCNRSRKMSFRVKNKKSQYSTSSRAVLFCSSHAMTPSVICYNADARENETYVLNSKTRCDTIMKYTAKNTQVATSLLTSWNNLLQLDDKPVASCQQTCCKLII